MKTPSEKLELRKLQSALSSYIESSTSSFSKLIHEPVHQHFSKLVDAEISKIEFLIPEILEDVFAVYIRCEGDLRIGMMFFLPETESKNLAARLLKKPQKNLTELGKSSIAELGSIMTGSFLTALSNETGLHIQASVAGSSIDTLRSLMQPSVSYIAKKSERVIVGISELKTRSGIILYFIVTLDPHEIKKILAKAGS